MEKAILEAYLLEHIPITSAMGVKVKIATPERVLLGAPFSNNINHKKTVFGGSLHAVATLACWSLVHINLEREHAQIVIAESSVKYLAPVASDFTAECLKPETVEWDRFLTMLHKKGRARVKLSARIIHEGKLCVDYCGAFAALLNTNQTF